MHTQKYMHTQHTPIPRPVAAHTPGPWFTKPRDQLIRAKSPHTSDLHDGCLAVGIAFGATVGPETSAANARLMAAAPELLAMLERLTHPMADDDDVDSAVALIAKVREGKA